MAVGCVNILLKVPIRRSLLPDVSCRREFRFPTLKPLYAKTLHTHGGGKN